MRLPGSLLLLGVATVHAAAADGTTVPFELERNKVVIPARIDGGPELRLTLDTGMVRGVLLRRPEPAAQAGLTPTRKIVVNGAGAGAPIEADVADARELVVGGLRLGSLSVVIMPAASEYARMSSGSLADGVVGHSLFERYVVEIDYDTLRVRFHDPDTFAPEDGGTELPIRIQGGKPYVRGRVGLGDGTSLAVKLVVDTGASKGLYLNPESHERIRPPERSVETILGRGVLGKRRGRIGRVSSLRLGELVLQDIVTGFPEARIRGLAPDRHGLLGNEVLSRFNTVFDYRRRRIILYPNDRHRGPMEYDMVGLQFDPGESDAGAFTIDDVVAASPADEAGIREGDALTAIDGVPVAELTPWQVEEMFRAHPGREYALELKRGDARMSVRVRLRRLI